MYVILSINLWFCSYLIAAFKVIGCYDKDPATYVKSVDSIDGATINLYCNFCGATQKATMANWLYRKRGDSILKTFKTSYRETNNSKITIFQYEMLVIHDFNMNDSGIYICKRTDNDNNRTFTYVVDGVFRNNINPKLGTYTQFLVLEEKQMDKLNKKFITSQDEPYTSLRKSNITFILKMSWGLWSSCKRYKRYEGIREIIGQYRLQPTPVKKFWNTSSKDELIKYYLKDNFDISCRSIKLNETFPLISKLVRNLPDYEATESCDLDTDNNYLENGGDSDVSSKILMQTAENGHCTLICSEGTLSSKINWYKNQQLLNSSYRNNMADKKGEPHITIDAYNSLYILRATKNEEGTYTCTVNGIKSREYYVTIVSMAKILNQDFIRYSIYLGFVLSVTVTCYCAGLCVAWHRRTSFADPLHLNYKKTCSNDESKALLNEG